MSYTLEMNVIYCIENKTLAVKNFGEIVILKHWRKKVWRIQGLPAFSL